MCMHVCVYIHSYMYSQYTLWNMWLYSREYIVSLNLWYCPWVLVFEPICWLVLYNQPSIRALSPTLMLAVAEPSVKSKVKSAIYEGPSVTRLLPVNCKEVLMQCSSGNGVYSANVIVSIFLLSSNVCQHRELLLLVLLCPCAALEMIRDTSASQSYKVNILLGEPSLVWPCRLLQHYRYCM